MPRQIPATLDMLWEIVPPHVLLKAHGTAVATPLRRRHVAAARSGTNARGAGTGFRTGRKACFSGNPSKSGKMFDLRTHGELVSQRKGQQYRTLHFLGLFSDGNVHSHIDHLKAMIVDAKQDGVKTRASPYPSRRS